MSFTEIHVKNENQSTSKHDHDKQYREDNVISSEILDLYNEANVIIQKKNEKIIMENNKRGAFIISKQVFKKSFLLFICAFYCLIFNGVLGASILTYVDGFNTNKIESYLCAVFHLSAQFLKLCVELLLNTMSPIPTNNSAIKLSPTNAIFTSLKQSILLYVLSCIYIDSSVLR